MQVDPSTWQGPTWRRSLRRWGRRIVAELLPYPCLECHTLAHPNDRGLGLCPRCRLSIRSRSAHPCRGCGCPLFTMGSHLGLCGSCLGAPPPYRSLWAAFDYEPPVTSVVRGLKFRGLDYLGSDLALAILAADHVPLLDRVDVVTPVPLSWPRYWSRGFNQAEAIARPLAQALGLPLRLLLRRRLRPPQAVLSRHHRLSNLRASFRCVGPDLAGSHVLLVDDVVTTGSTVATATRCLLSSGAESVIVAVAARTPAWSESVRIGPYLAGAPERSST